MVYKYPPFLIVRPDLYTFRGEDYTRLMDLYERGVLLPGDIIMRKTNSSITFGLVPGPFDHAGLYVGATSKGSPAIIQAVSTGVELVSLYDFCRADDIIVVRPKHIPKHLRHKVATQAYHYLGRPYDFDFSYNDDSRLYCFELVGRCYEAIKNTYKFKLSTLGYWIFRKKVLLSKDILASDVDVVFERG